MSEPVFLRPEVVAFLHERSLQQHGGARGLRDAALLDSALARPRNRRIYDPDADLHTLAAAYAFGLVRNHPFVDGNKRVAWAACLAFLRCNGLRIQGSTDAERVTLVMDLAAGHIDEALFAGWLARHGMVLPG
jgi:death-on-curing protein